MRFSRLTIISAATIIPLAALAAKPAISGRVTADGHPLAGVAVSDGVTVVKTDNNGYYAISKSDKADSTVYITTPSGYTALSMDGFQPGFWRHLESDAKTPETHDFTLMSENQDSYSIVFVTDMHLINEPTRHDIVQFQSLALPRIKELAKEYGSQHTVYAMNLGDITQDTYWYANNFRVDRIPGYMKSIGWPLRTYSVTGNHDHDSAIADGTNTDCKAGWLYRRTLGPAQYSINIGSDHWIMMDNIRYNNRLTNKAKAVGAAGDRSYDCGFTPSQMKWLRQDVAELPDDTPIYLCTHAPILIDRKNGLLISEAEMEELSGILGRFNKVVIYSGHSHRQQHKFKKDFHPFEQHILGATSGNIWICNGFKLQSVDGSDAGVLVGTYTHGNRDHTFRSFDGADNVMRIYDLNGVGEYYRTDFDMQTALGFYPNRINYSNPEFNNGILINYWMLEPEQRVEVYENGNRIDVEQVSFEDPLYCMSYFVPAVIRTQKPKKSHENITNTHMFMAKGKTADGTIEVRIVDNTDRVVHLQKLTRPNHFNPDFQ